jgi:hypothetical protein
MRQFQTADNSNPEVKNTSQQVESVPSNEKVLILEKVEPNSPYQVKKPEPLSLEDRLSSARNRDEKGGDEPLTSLSQSALSLKDRPRVLTDRYQPVSRGATTYGGVQALQVAEEYKQKYLQLECEYEALKASHAYELSRHKFKLDEQELRSKEKMTQEVAEAQRRASEQLLTKDL